MKVKVVASPEGKHPVRIEEILDKTKFDPEQGTAGVQKALRVIQAPEPGVQYISLVTVAIQTPAQVVECIQLALQSATQGQRCTRTPRSPRHLSLVSYTTTYPAGEVDTSVRARKSHLRSDLWPRLGPPSRSDRSPFVPQDSTCGSRHHE